MAGTEDWLYNDDLDVQLSAERDRLDSTDSRVLDGEDLLDDVLTAPATAPSRSFRTTSEDELLGMKTEVQHAGMEESGSARFNAEQMARTVQARIEANRTSQVGNPKTGPSIYSREPNRKNSVFIGNLTWWTTDQDLIQAVREVGLKEVFNIKFFENRANGQSKGYALIELSSESLAVTASERLQELTIHGQKPIAVYAAKMSPHQFEIKCNQVKSGDSPTLPSSTSIANRQQKTQLSMSTPSITPPIRPPLPMPGMPPPIPGLRPPGFPDPIAGFPPILPPFPPGIPPMPHLGNPLAAAAAAAGLRPGMLPGVVPPFPPSLGEPAKAIAPHLNPAFLQEMSQHGGNMAEFFAKAAAKFQSQAVAMNMGSRKSPMPTEEEASDANQRNRAISSSAITRAMSDANAGDFEGAIDTLRMAITLIKQSMTAGTETSQILIQSLQDCLHGIEQQASYKRSRGRDHRSHDDRDRARSSHRSTKHHRDRSRERRR